MIDLRTSVIACPVCDDSLLLDVETVIVEEHQAVDGFWLRWKPGHLACKEHLRRNPIPYDLILQERVDRILDRYEGSAP